MGLTALDILVILLVGAGLVFGCHARLRRRGAVAVRLVPGDPCPALSARAGPRSRWSGRSGPSPAPRCSPSSLVFGLVFIGGKLASRRLGGRVRNSVVGPVDRVLGAGFGALKGLIGATLLYLGVTLVYDTIWGRAAERPEWMANARTYPLLQSSGATIVDLVEARARRRDAAEASAQNAQNAQ